MNINKKKKIIILLGFTLSFIFDSNFIFSLLKNK